MVGGYCCGAMGAAQWMRKRVTVVVTDADADADADTTLPNQCNCCCSTVALLRSLVCSLVVFKQSISLAKKEHVSRVESSRIDELSR